MNPFKRTTYCGSSAQSNHSTDITSNYSQTASATTMQESENEGVSSGYSSESEAYSNSSTVGDLDEGTRKLSISSQRPSIASASTTSSGRCKCGKCASNEGGNHRRCESGIASLFSHKKHGSHAGSKPEEFTKDKETQTGESDIDRLAQNPDTENDHDGGQSPFRLGVPCDSLWQTLVTPIASGIASIAGVAGHKADEMVEAISYDDASFTSDREDSEFGRKERIVGPRSQAIRHSLKPNFITDKLPHVGGPVVILGGYRGSHLADKRTNKRVWVPYKAGLGIGKATLELGLTDEDEKNSEDLIFPESILDRVGPVDICHKLIKLLGDQDGTTVYPYAYDWRLSGHTMSDKLYNYIKDVHNKEGKPVLIIAHSMGGLIAHHVLQRFIRANPRCQKIVRGILYAGCPSECMQILGPLHLGDTLLLSKKILTAKINFTMRSSFIFLPKTGIMFANEEDVTEEYPIDFYDPDSWIKYNLSPCVSRDPDIRRQQIAEDIHQKELPFGKAVDYLTEHLARAKQFHKELEPIENASYPPLCVLYGNTTATCRGVKVPSRSAISTDNYSNYWYGCGDGVVSRKSLLPLTYGYTNVDTVASKHTHAGLLADIPAVAEALSCMLRQEGIEPVMEEESGIRPLHTVTEIIGKSVQLPRDILHRHSKNRSETLIK